MASRRALKAVAHNVCKTLVSRNDDIDGFWAIGQLLKYALSKATPDFTIDLLAGTSSPAIESEPLTRLPQAWADVFAASIEGQKVLRSHVTAAVVVADFDLANGREGLGRPQPQYLLKLRVTIQDDRNRSDDWAEEIWCGEHDPVLERESTRGA